MYEKMSGRAKIVTDTHTHTHTHTPVVEDARAESRAEVARSGMQQPVVPEDHFAPVRKWNGRVSIFFTGSR